MKSVAKILGRGGTIFTFARRKEFRDYDARAKATEQLKNRGVDGLVVIGGEGCLLRPNY